MRKAETGVHPIAIEVAPAAALSFLAVTWVSFARGGEVDWDLVIVTLLFILRTPEHRDLWIEDARWRQRDTSFREFLDSEVGTATGQMRGRDHPSVARSRRDRYQPRSACPALDSLSPGRQ